MSEVNWSFVLVGCIGGLIPDALRIIKGRYRKNVPGYLKGLNFWLGVVLLAALGGLAAWVLAAESFREAATYGFAAPELISKLAAKSVEQIDRGDGPFDLRKWWAG